MKLYEKIIEDIFAKKLKNDLQSSGLLSQDEVDKAVQEFRTDSRASSEAQKRENQANKARHYQALVNGQRCSTCKYYYWGECWYYYEGNPGFNYDSKYRFDYHGETQKINYPDNTTCNNYKRDWNK